MLKQSGSSVVELCPVQILVVVAINQMQPLKIEEEENSISTLFEYGLVGL